MTSGETSIRSTLDRSSHLKPSERLAIDPSFEKLMETAGLFKALDSFIRLRIIELLAERDHFVYELVDALDSSQPLISQHLRVLRKAKIVDCARNGRLITYTLSCRGILDVIELAAATCES